MDLTYGLVNATIARCRASTARNVTLLLVICTDLAILISNLSSVIIQRGLPLVTAVVGVHLVF